MEKVFLFFLLYSMPENTPDGIGLNLFNVLLYKITLNIVDYFSLSPTYIIVSLFIHVNFFTKKYVTK